MLLSYVFSYRLLIDVCFCVFVVFCFFFVFLFSIPSSTPPPLEVRLLLLALAPALVLILRCHARLLRSKPNERLRLAIVHQKVLLTETALLPLGLVRHLPLQHLRYGLALEFLVHLLLPVRERCPCLGLLRLLRQVHWLVHWQVLHRGLLTVSRCLGHCRSRLAELRRRTLLLHHQLHPLGLLRRQLQAYRVGRRHIAMSLIALRTCTLKLRFLTSLLLSSSILYLYYVGYSATPYVFPSFSLFNFMSLLCRLSPYFSPSSLLLSLLTSPSPSSLLTSPSPSSLLTSPSPLLTSLYSSYM